MYSEYAIELYVPREHRGLVLKAYAGIGKTATPERSARKVLRSCAEFDPSGNKQTSDLKSALLKAGIQNGMVVSTHHHLRNGDHVAGQLFAAAAELGIKDLIWFPSAVFPCHESLIPYLENGTIHHIQGSLNGPIGDFASRGKMHDLALLRSHGSRYRAIQDGDISVGIAVIAAPSCDHFGNMTGAIGPSACGVLGFAVADAEYANHVIAVTDNLVPFPCAPWQIAGNNVDQVVVVDSIGDPAGIVSGTTQITRSPERQFIAELAVQFVIEAEILKEGWSFQAGAGGTSLAFTAYAAREMRERGIRASFVRGGSTAVAVEMLESGQTSFLLDGQTFDLEGVRSVRENPNHVMTSPFNSYNYHGKGNIASILDCAVLGATEIDLDFNANVVTHSDGRMLHGIGGWQDALFSKCTILAVPSMRNRVPVIREKLTTFCGPGELIDVVVTETGVAINPLRKDLIQAVSGLNLPLVTLQEIKDSSEKMAGGPPKPASQVGRIIGLVSWVDGTIIDVIRQIEI